MSSASAVARFLLGSLAAIAVILVGGFFALRDVATEEAERDTRERVTIEGQLIATALTDGVLTGDSAALAAVDDIVQGQILGESVVRVKLWAQDGTILYSDEPRLIGQRFALGEEEAELFETGGSDAELSDLSEPENRFEREEGKLLEAHAPIRTPNGTQVLFEIYQRFSSVNASASRILSALLPPMVGGPRTPADRVRPARRRRAGPGRRRVRAGAARRGRAAARERRGGATRRSSTASPARPCATSSCTPRRGRSRSRSRPPRSPSPTTAAASTRRKEPTAPRRATSAWTC